MLTERFEAALVYATHLHAIQERKDTKIPYVSHLLSVTALPSFVTPVDFAE